MSTCCSVCVLLSYLLFYTCIVVLVVLCVCILFVFVILCELMYVCVAGYTLDAELLARIQYLTFLRPATSTQVFLGFLMSISKC